MSMQEKMKEVYVKCYALDSMIEHLDHVKKNDKRKRERLRAEIGLKTINKWLDFGAIDYDKNRGKY